MSEQILFVDDDFNLLTSYQRQLRSKYRVETSVDGQGGLETISRNGPYAVVVSDYRMPGMNGVQFLSRVRERAPDTVRMLLTGYADLQTAIEAVNQGNIFRLLTKPCPPDTLTSALDAGVDQYRLVTAERERAEKEKTSLKEQLFQAQKMEAIGTLAGGIAHDFNNILAAIVGYGELIGWEVPRASKAEDNLKELLKAAGRARDLVQQILTFSRQSKQERKPIEIGLIVKETLKLLRASLPASVEIRQEIEKDIGRVEADPTQVHQVLMNLCTNAAHAMSENGGLLEISLSKVDLDANTAAQYSHLLPGPYIKLSVSDTGHGMSPEVLERIFDPYFTTKEVGKGTGLGLAVVHGIVKSYQGAIMAYSKPGQGATFHIYLPRIDDARGVTDIQEVEPLIMGGNERILFIDDEQALVDVGEQILKHLGYQVSGRTSSIEALELFRIHPERFDLVVTDMAMPNMTGDKVARELMRIRDDVPIVLCTGFSEYLTEEAAKKIGIREFVMKPLVTSELAKTIRRALDGQKKR